MPYPDHISLKLPNKEQENKADPDFLLYVMDLSYFSGKLEAYFRYQDFNFKRIEPLVSELAEIKKETGTSQVPLVFDNIKKQWLRDTTYVIEYMETEYKQISILPSCPIQSFFSSLLEDFADEYMWRPAMYYRWEPTFDSKQLSLRFTYEFADAPGLSGLVPQSLHAPAMLFRQWLFSVFGEGIQEPEQHDIVKSQYLVVLKTLQTILSQTAFLLGSHPTLVDFAFMGPFFRHFASDPTGRKIMQQKAPAVFEWIGRMWNCKHDKLPATFSASCKDGTLPESWNGFFPLVAEYLNYLHQNAVAWQQGLTSFEFPYKGGCATSKNSTVQTVPYRVWCRLKLQQRVNALSTQEVKEEVDSLLRLHHCWEPLWRDGQIECPPELGVEPPFCVPPQSSKNVDSPKWPLKPLLVRYAKYRVRDLFSQNIFILGFLFVALLIFLNYLL